ncbi:hypothetical protein V1264_001697 [Littorina saxatilis]|uniref:HECT domain-containing protein n=2 Tax=Littorina saxatilis TaxID=31220 RepID=A0AAN9C201_9CAEN
MSANTPAALRREMGHSRSALYVRLTTGADLNDILPDLGERRRRRRRNGGRMTHVTLGTPTIQGLIPALPADSSNDAFDLEREPNFRNPPSQATATGESTGTVDAGHNLEDTLPFVEETSQTTEGTREGQLQEFRSTRAQTDLEFAASLTADRGRERERLQQQRAVEAREEALQLLRTENASLLGEEPENGFVLRVRNDGRRRRFLPSDRMTTLGNFILAGAEQMSFTVSWHGCNNKPTSSTLDGDLRQWDLTSATVLDIEWDDAVHHPVFPTIHIDNNISSAEEEEVPGLTIGWKRPRCSQRDIKPALATYKETAITDGVSNTNFARTGSLLQTALNRFGRSRFIATDCPEIKFIGEDGQDGGGLRRELFQLLLRHMKTSSSLLFETGKGLLPQVDFSNLPEVKALGVLVGMMVLHSGPAPALFHPSLVDFALSGEVQHVEELFPVLSQVELQKFRKGENHNVEIVAPLLEDIKTARINLPAESAYQAILQQRRCVVAPFLAAFWEGAQRVGLHDAIKTHHELSRLLDFDIHETTANELLQAMEPSFSSLEEGSNLSTRARELYEEIESYVYDLEDGKCGETSIADFLFFMTGSRSIVPGGFHSPLTVVFVDTPEKPLPRVSTCALTMQVSAQLTRQELRQKLSQAVLEGGGFFLL